MNEKLLTVIIPVYNAENYLNKCLDSVVNQSYTNLEIILINDGSTDSSPKIMDDFASKDNRINTIHKANGGIGSAYKMAFEIMKGDFITFVDSDDYLSINAYLELMQLVDTNNPDMVHFGVDVFDENGDQAKNISFKAMDKISNSNIEILHDHYNVLKHPTLCRIYRKKLFDNVIVYEQNIGIDEMLTPQLLYQCKKAVYTSKSYYFVLARENSVCRTAYNERKVLQSLKVNRFVCSFMNQKDLNEYAVFSNLKFLKTLHNIYNDSVLDKKLINRNLKGEVYTDLKNMYHKVKSTVMFNEELKTVKNAIFLIVYLPHLYSFLYRINKRK